MYILSSWFIMLWFLVILCILKTKLVLGDFNEKIGRRKQTLKLWNNCNHFFMLPERCFVQLSQNLVRQITLKLLLPFKSNLVYRYMAVRWRAVYKNHNPTLYIYKVISLNFVFVIMDACLSNILESTKGIEMKLGL